MSKQFPEAVASLLTFFGGLRVDFSRSYRTRLPSRTVECVAKCLDHAGEIFLAEELRQAYERLSEAFYRKPVDPESLKLSDEELRRLATMDDEDRKQWMAFLCRSAEWLQRDLEEAKGPLVKLLKQAKRKKATPYTGKGEASRGAIFDAASNSLILNGKPLSLSSGERYVLASLVAKRTASFRELQNAHPRPDKVLKELRNKHRNLKKFIFLPGGPCKGGYSTTIKMKKKSARSRQK